MASVGLELLVVWWATRLRPYRSLDDYLKSTSDCQMGFTSFLR